MKKLVWGTLGLIILITIGYGVSRLVVPVLTEKHQSTYIRIGVTGPKSEIDTTKYMQGINLALNQYNSKSSTRKKIQLVVRDDAGDINTGLRVAQEFVNDRSILGVIGHWDSNIAIPAADIYENAGLPMLSPVVSNPQLYRSKKNYIFGTIPGDAYVADIMAQYAKTRNYQRMAVYYVDSLYGAELSKAFCKSAEKRGIIIIDRHANFLSKLEMEMTINKWKMLDCQAVFIADGMPEAGEVIKEIKDWGLNVPVLGDWGLDLSDVLGELGKYAENLVYPTLYKPNSPRKQLRKFEREFAKSFGEPPDLWAVLGYDAMTLLEYAIDNAKSKSRKEVALTLKTTGSWPAALYDMTFSDNGELINPVLVIKKIVNGRYVYEN